MESNAPVTANINDFFSHFREVFRQNNIDLSVYDQLFNLCQSEETVSMYALRFRTLAAASGWNETALITAFRQGLNPQVKQLMVVYDDCMGLENLIQETLRVAQRFSACSVFMPTANPLPTSPSVTLPAPEQMQEDSYRLTRAERQRRIQQHLCLYCGGEDHFITACPI